MAPALNTVLYRFDEDEVRYILTYGRPGSPMSAWGLAGGGPMNAQQIETLIAYLKSIQIPREDCAPEEEGDPLLRERAPAGARPRQDIETLARQSVEDGTYAQLRRGAVQPRPRQRRLQLRPLPHERAGATATPACPARARSAGTSPAAATTRQLPERRRTMIDFVSDGLEQRRRLRPAGAGQRPDARLRGDAHRRADRRDRRVRAEPVMTAIDRSLAHRLGARAPRHPHRHHRGRRAVRQRLPDPGHQPRRPPRLPRRPRRPRRLDGADGRSSG